MYFILDMGIGLEGFPEVGIFADYLSSSGELS